MLENIMLTANKEGVPNVSTSSTKLAVIPPRNPNTKSTSNITSETAPNNGMIRTDSGPALRNLRDSFLQIQTGAKKSELNTRKETSAIRQPAPKPATPKLFCKFRDPSGHNGYFL